MKMLFDPARARFAIVGALLLSSSAWALSPGGGATTDTFADYAVAGPHAVMSEASGSTCTVFRPVTLTDDHPVILWGNGTSTQVSAYSEGLEHWASWGYVVVAANTSNAGTGEQMLDCLDGISGSAIADSLDLTRVGTTGHSQGGGGSLMAGRDERITATAPIQPYVVGLGHDSASQGDQTGPMLLLSGSSDFVASPSRNQAPVYQAANVPVFWANSQGTSHFAPIGDLGVYRGITTAWWDYQLKGDQDAADLFAGPCLGCDAEGWDVQRKGF
ncbi:hypothetical protein [Hydrocarboniclastica marina]|uniref:poly(ethylene terephthalate) hydrolase family protein n=1 Tax=Hydrocarboniclastica marina TaxID=2259620 RepID=UPI001FE3748F|nr:hypothetical protein [Hydrocarboniclastica marina]